MPIVDPPRRALVALLVLGLTLVVLRAPWSDGPRAEAPRAAIKATPRQDGVDEIRVPGERAYRERARLTREGIEIDRRIHDALNRLAEGKHA